MSIRPFMVEFTGTPESGKTTAIMSLIKKLKEKNLKVGYIQESAELISYEIPKSSFDSNIWMTYITLAKIILFSYEDYDIVLIDRGAWDRLFFNQKMYSEGKCTFHEKKAHDTFIKDKRFWPDKVIAFSVSPEVSIERRGGEGRIVTLQYVKGYNKIFHKFIKNKVKSPVTFVDTSNLTKEAVVETTLNTILDDYYKSKKNAKD